MAGRLVRERAAIALAEKQDELQYAAREITALQLIVACLLSRLPARQATITRKEITAILDARGTGIDRATDERTGEMLIRVSAPDEAPPKKTVVKVERRLIRPVGT